jgi:UDPglucose 6-dehydrogenase
VGCGHVGLVTGGCLAAIGHHVICADCDAGRIRLLEEGILPVYEPYLTELIQQSRAAGLLSFTLDTGCAVRNSDVIFLCVGIPQLDNGESDFAALDSAAKQIAFAADSPKVVVERSTVPVQTGEQLKHLFCVYSKNHHASFQVAANPQFLREGIAVEEFLHADRILLGVEDTQSERTLREVYAPILQQTFQCPIHSKTCPQYEPPKLVLTSVQSAELIKHASNAFLAVKISYANVLADLCERFGANVQEVTHAVGLDPRIGTAFLRAGIGFGGERLPRDLRAFRTLVEKAGVDAGILQAAEDINRRRINAFFEKLLGFLWVLKDKQVGLLGLAHKANTDDIRGSPAIEFYKRLTAAGARVCAYDPRAIPNTRILFPHLIFCRDAYHAAEEADALVIVTEWEEFRHLDWPLVRDLMVRPLVVDGRNLLDPAYMKSLGFEYHSVGRPS